MKIIFNLWAIFFALSMYALIIFPISIPLLFCSRKVKQFVMEITWPFFSRLILYCALLNQANIVDKRKSKKMRGLYICNHLGAADIPLVHTQIVAPSIMKIELLKIPFIGWSAYLFGLIPVNRKDKNSRFKALKKAEEILSKNFPLLYYPEGTRSRTNVPKPFNEIHRKIIDFAFENNIDVTSISIYGTQKVVPFGKFNMMIHEELSPKNFQNKDKFAEELWNNVLSGFFFFRKL